MLNYNNSIKNNARITSDNYDVVIYSKDISGNEIVYNLTRDYGLTSFSWTSKDDIVIKRPVTRLDPISCVKQNGFDLDFVFAKENLDDLMQLLLYQHQYYYNNEKDGLNIKRNIGQSRASTVAGATDDSSGDYSKNQFNTPIYDIQINMRHLLNAEDKNKTESFKFRNVTLYQPSQKVEENSGFIVEAFKGFASYVEVISTVAEGNNFPQYVLENTEHYTTFQNAQYVRKTVLNLNKINQ